MASFDLGFDVAAPPEDADILNDIFSQDIVFEEVITYETQQELEKTFSEDRKENFAPLIVEISQKRFKSVVENEFNELEEKKTIEGHQKKVQNGVSNSFKV